ncbi:MAG: DUF4403 family protein [Geobacter sp.]|nr:DUF4403 family protein [Geobacter sp.]
MRKTVITSRLLLTLLCFILGTTCSFAAVPPSSINLSVEASCSDLAAMINKALPKELYKGKGGLGITVTVLRTGPVTVAASDNFVYFALPIQLTFSNALYESYPLRAGLRFRARVSVLPDWRLRTELYYTGLTDNLVDNFKLGPISLKPKSLVENVSQPVQQLLAPIIDTKVNESVQLRAKIAPLWQSAFEPKLVSKEFSAWLKLTPQKIVMTPLLAASNRLLLSIGVISGAEITIGPKPAATPARQLPPVQQVGTLDNSFHIQLGADIFFADLTAALKPVLLDKSFGDDKKITIKSFHLQGDEGRLVVVLTSTGDFDGELTLFAKPVYNPQQNSLTFENIDFDTRNAGWLISTGSWLFSSTIRETIKTKLDAAVVEQLDKARSKASSALSAVQVAEHVKLSGAVKSLTLGEATVQKDRLTLQIVVQGESSVSLK